jgi:sugar (pentulose or hexulose) kinase
MLWAGLDLGTTHCKALLYDDRAHRIAAMATVPTPVLNDGLHSSRDAEAVSQLAIDLLASAPRDVGVSREVGGIAVASVGEEIVTIDADGEPTGRTIAWFDPRGHDEAEAFARESAPALHARSAPDSSFSLFKLLWLHGHRRDELARCVGLVDLSGYLLTRLGAQGAMDWSHASCTGLLDPEAGAWDAETSAAARIPAGWLPPLVPSGTEVGRLGTAAASRLGVAAGTPLVTGGHDHFCGAFASGVRQAGEFFVPAGTSEAQLVLTGGPVSGTVDGTPFDQGRFVDRTTSYVHVGRPLGRTYQRWRGLLFGGESDAVVDAEVGRAYHVEVERHYYSLPYGLVGERVDVRASARTIEVFARGRRVASHVRSAVDDHRRFPRPDH